MRSSLFRASFCLAMAMFAINTLSMRYVISNKGPAALDGCRGNQIFTSDLTGQSPRFESFVNLHVDE